MDAPASAAAAAATGDPPHRQGSETCCADCYGSQRIVWSATWNRWLCGLCVTVRTDNELGSSL